MKSKIQYGPDKNGTKCGDKNKVQDVQEKDEQEYKNDDCAEEIQYEQDIHVMRILNVVQGDHSLKHADNEIQSAEDCDRCSRIRMEVLGMISK